MTLVELLMALAGTSFVGAAVVSMLFVMSRGTQDDRDMRTFVVQYKTIDARLGAAIRGASMVLDKGDDYLVLWMYDEDDDGRPSLAEVRRIAWSDGVLTSFSAPKDLPAADNIIWDLTTNWNAVTTVLAGTVIFPEEVWAMNVSDCVVTLDNAEPQASRLVSYRVTLTVGGVSDVAINAAALRNRG